MIPNTKHIHTNTDKKGKKGKKEKGDDAPPEPTPPPPVVLSERSCQTEAPRELLAYVGMWRECALFI